MKFVSDICPLPSYGSTFPQIRVSLQLHSTAQINKTSSPSTTRQLFQTALADHRVKYHSMEFNILMMV
jgi:hypothetical protein